MNRHLPPTMYLVLTIGWELEEWEGGRPRFRCPDEEEGTPEQTFGDRDTAEACCAELEREKRAEVNPFQYCERVEELTHFDADRWHDWLLDVGLEPPPPPRTPRLERGR